jgi:transcriptional regulator with XRE-family HTH domain
MAVEEAELFLKVFGEKISELRNSKNLSYRKLAQRCNVDYSDISKIEKGLIKIQLPTILELAKGLEVHPRDLFNFNFPMDHYIKE